jgi:hypothetical protein
VLAELEVGMFAGIPLVYYRFACGAPAAEPISRGGRIAAEIPFWRT